MNRTNSLVPVIFISAIFYGASYGQWQKMNLPVSARVNTIQIRDSFIFAGTEGDGIFVSTDDGESWTSRSTGLQDTLIHTIMILGNSIFAGTETGVSVSTDNGVSWRSINSGLSGLGVWSLGVSGLPYSDTTIFAGSWSGVYSSTDRGENWRVAGLSSTTTPVHSIVIFDRYIYAATFGEGIFLSYDNGLTWKNIIITAYDPTVPIGTSVPICSISTFAGPSFNFVVVGSSFGDFYYMDYRYAGFLDASENERQGVPILSFANKNDTLIAANSNGYFFDCYYSDHELNCSPSNIPDLGGRTVYSLAVNETHIFAGTGDGVWRLSYPLTITKVENSPDPPSGFVLEQNYPNPFNPTTMISYQLAAISDVTLKVYNMLGRDVATLVNGRQDAGTHLVKFDGSNLPSGTYFYRLRCGTYTATKKLLLLK